MLRNVYTINTFLALSLATLSHTNEDVRSTAIDSRVFTLMDGFDLGYNNVHKAHVFIVKTQELLSGKKDHTGSIVGLLPFQGHWLSVKQLVALEKMHENNPAQTEYLQRALHKAIEFFESISEEHLKETKGAATKEMTTELIEKWSAQRNLPNTILLDWSSVEEGQEKEHFRRMITNFSQLESFLEDLKMFLKDFMHSCPKSLEKYKAALLEARARNEAHHGHR